MVRLLNLIAIIALVGSAIYAYSIKYETIFYAEELTRLKHKIKAEQDAIAMARADWGHLTRPERLQSLSDKLLDLQPLALAQIVKPDALPEHAPKVDAIGRKLEALGLSEPTNTPRSEDMGISATTPSAARR
jgi:hypothetical protein